MSDAIVVALITGGLSMLSAIVTGIITSRKSEQRLKINQAVTDTKLEELTREVRLHNNFAQRMPVIEEQIRSIREEQGRLSQRLQNLEDI